MSITLLIPIWAPGNGYHHSKARSSIDYRIAILFNVIAEGKPLKVNEIAASQSLPERYLDQIFTSLKRQGIISSQRGMKGGYLLAKELWQITLLDVVMAIEGPIANSG